MSYNFLCNRDDPGFLQFIGKVRFVINSSKKTYLQERKLFCKYYTVAFEELLMELPSEYPGNGNFGFLKGEFANEVKEIIDYLFSAWGNIQKQTTLPFTADPGSEQEIYNQIKF